ncbi:putative integral membrane protein [[Actinomadura] parvosata subsp. kistnae]|uniref:Uncharacterized protein n=1 Tax=[Actinomadura] parvosata subsp. kistnae TaxID=1909395 RepID=A0A1V0A5D3_9ACTN|nr:hypothetical protein [Nonomuraea sp. ATCC 55076]AQZ65436.1 hypothetical protein BKM31_31810 [Nonomuraea sp. ATCC 55076]SPL96769.1 putative integral membrane protein [Actinomadura parvosata subsp. kistnae]
MNPDQKGCGTGSRDTAQAGRPGLRGLRAAVFAVVCVLAALGMHVLAGGPITGLGTVVAATVATGAGAFALARRRRSLGTLLTASFAAQYGMHQLFTAGTLAPPHHHTAPGADTTALTTSLTTGLTTGLADHHGGGLYSGIGMLLAHVLVAAVSAWWLDCGETALAALLRLLACSLHDLWALLTARATALAALPLRAPAPVSAGTTAVLTSQVLAWTLCRRGPPR